VPSDNRAIRATVSTEGAVFGTRPVRNRHDGPFSRAALINWVGARRPEVGRGLYVRRRDVHRPEAAAVPSGRVLLIGSSGARTAEPAAAALLFFGPGFAHARDAAVRSGVPWFVLSAKHGLLDPADVVAPYDVQIGDQSAGYRTAWGEWVAAQLAERVRLDGVTAEVHGGVDFAPPLRQPLGLPTRAVSLLSCAPRQRARRV
jgi:hypothetical protein